MCIIPHKGAVENPCGEVCGKCGKVPDFHSKTGRIPTLHPGKAVHNFLHKPISGERITVLRHRLYPVTEGAKMGEKVGKRETVHSHQGLWWEMAEKFL